MTAGDKTARVGYWARAGGSGVSRWLGGLGLASTGYAGLFGTAITAVRRDLTGIGAGTRLDVIGEQTSRNIRNRLLFCFSDPLQFVAISLAHFDWQNNQFVRHGFTC